MSIFYNQLRHALEILSDYNGGEPFHLYIKKFFANHKQYGSRDRKLLSSLCYSWFRAGRCFRTQDKESQLILSFYLCSKELNPFLDFQLQAKEWTELKDSVAADVTSKTNTLKQIFPDFDFSQVFPFSAALSENIDEEAFRTYHLLQPLVWIRVKASYFGKVKEVLSSQGIHPVTSEILPHTFGLPPMSKLDVLLGKFMEVIEVQDLSSQQAGLLYAESTALNWWDCCSGSGGKSLLLMQHHPEINLHASDVRPSIIQNLQKRLKENRVKHYRVAQADLEKRPDHITFTAQDGDKIRAAKGYFDAIIADVPCSGSGTWARTPEMLEFFKESAIKEYQLKQRSILSTAIQFLKPGGDLFFSTCSVFREENEENAEFLESCGLRKLKEQMIKGYEQQSDSLYICQFTL